MSTFELFITIGMAMWIVISIALTILSINSIRTIKGVVGPLRQLAKTAEEVGERLQPTIRNVERASEDVNYIVASLRTDLETISATARNAAESTDRMIGMMEERVADLNGLLEVVQEEAEETFYSTASLLRGLRRGRRAVEKAGSIRRAIGGGRN